MYFVTGTGLFCLKIETPQERTHLNKMVLWDIAHFSSKAKKRDTCGKIHHKNKKNYNKKRIDLLMTGWAVPTKKTSQLKNNHKKLTAHLLNALNKGGGGHSPPYCFPP